MQTRSRVQCRIAWRRRRHLVRDIISVPPSCSTLPQSIPAHTHHMHRTSQKHAISTSQNLCSSSRYLSEPLFCCQPSENSISYSDDTLINFWHRRTKVWPRKNAMPGKVSRFGTFVYTYTPRRFWQQTDMAMMYPVTGSP